MLEGAHRSPPQEIKLLKSFGPTFYMLFKEYFAAFLAGLHKK
jgi:hypothetical protein